MLSKNSNIRLNKKAVMNKMILKNSKRNNP